MDYVVKIDAIVMDNQTMEELLKERQDLKEGIASLLAVKNGSIEEKTEATNKAMKLLAENNKLVDFFAFSNGTYYEIGWRKGVLVGFLSSSIICAMIALIAALFVWVS